MGIGDDIRNKAQEATGKAKEFIGDKTGDADLQGEGVRDRTESGIRQAADSVREKAGDAADSLREGAEGLKAKAEGLIGGAKDAGEDR
ncbi:MULTISPECIES: CsbD family protein [Brevibacterium]|jgi:uncharacterized protein YjbJ (UPF0337 family)|uniref:CsbD family protein n=1 Tax=Brevibacterium salitolerans TaxID=1403566 RepID=A0ABP5IIW3_9MICO|nr:CsbD family protein [Brevibacterium sp.]